MFANKIVSLFTLALTVFTATEAHGWQDFPSFEDMMRESDLPQSGRFSNQPVLRPESAWPATYSENAQPAQPQPLRGQLPRTESARPQSQRPLDQTNRFTPSNQRSLSEFESFGSETGISINPERSSTPAGSALSNPRSAAPQRRSDGNRQFLDPFHRASSPQDSSAWPDNSRTKNPVDGVMPRANPNGAAGSAPVRGVGQSRFLPIGQNGNNRNIDASFIPPLPERDLSWDGRGLPDLDDTASAIPDDVFDWRTIRVSVGDVILPSNTVFQHTDSVLSLPEQTAYLNLIQEIEARGVALTKDPVLRELSANARMAAWEESFYEFTRARQMAFQNGKLRSESQAARLHNGFSDPFGKSPTSKSLVSQTGYDILDDIRRYPDHFTGRPIVLYGVFTPEAMRTISRTDGALDPTVSVAEEAPDEPLTAPASTYGLEYDADSRLKKATVLTGTLTSKATGGLLATIDTSGLVTPEQGLQDIQAPWRDMRPFPVLVKGWVVKKFQGDRPLIYCESMRLLSPESHRSLVTTRTYDKERIRSEEKWLYYETMRQLNLTDTNMQQALARQNVLDRIDVLQAEIIDKFRGQVKDLKLALKNKKIDDVKFEKQLGSLNRQYQLRKKRHENFKGSPDLFPTFVDVFENPKVWQGKNVTLTGHVRHAVKYDGDSTMFDGHPLYELWLFTEDSQENPAVIVTPELPDDFPLNADVVNQVSVTGCVFKRYVYTGQTERRIAPMILAGHVQWAPTVSHVASLVKSGDVSKGAPLAVRAKALEGRESGNMALVLISLVIIFGLMVLWGRAQREERDRLRLRDRIIDVVEIENGPTPEYASATDEYLNRVR